MKKYFVLIIIAALSIQSCSTTKRLPNSQTSNSQNSLDNVVYQGGDGSSIKEAVVILKARSTAVGIDAENAYRSKVYGTQGVKWNKLAQALVHDSNKDYDVITIQLLPSREELDIYFDITQFFGKW